MGTNTTRRQLIRLGTSAAAYAAGAAIVAGGVTAVSHAEGETFSADRRAWDRALADFKQASDISDRHWKEIEEPSYAPGASTNPADRERMSRESDRLLDRIADAEGRLFATPAPDMAAVQFKLDRLWNEQREMCPDWNALVFADVRRLTGETGQ